MTAVTGDTEYPRSAYDLAVRGRVSMRFVPVRSRLEWQTTEVDFLKSGAWGLRDARGDQTPRAARRALEGYLGGVSDRALHRFPRPEGVPDAWQLTKAFVFEEFWK
jgi:hypothetical protein